jgi:hypothetical protein
MKVTVCEFPDEQCLKDKAWASVNRSSYDSATFSGTSWLVSLEGDILAETNIDEPYQTVDIDFTEADAVKSTYPRNIYVT